jgi:hypothetical protein
MRIHLPLVVAIFSLASVGASDAATLVSPALKATSANRRFQCSVVNVSNEPRSAIFRIIRWDGVTIEGPSGVTTIPPGQLRLLTATSSNWAYCRVEVTGVKSDFRGHFELQTSINGIFETRVGVPLQ